MSTEKIDIAFCSQKKRAIVQCISYRLVYIPLSKHEAEYLELNMEHPAIRIKIPTKEAGLDALLATGGGGL